MVQISVVNNKLKECDKYETKNNLSVEAINVPVVHQVVLATLASRRQGNASTKTKAFVSGGGKKPFKQKGTGNARQGSTRSPLMPGGGTVFGPQPRCYEQKISKKKVGVAIKAVVADKLAAGKLIVVDSILFDGKTKSASNFLKDIKSSLVVLTKNDDKTLRSLSNLEKHRGLVVDHFSVYEAVKYETLIIEKSALEYLEGRMV